MHFYERPSTKQWQDQPIYMYSDQRESSVFVSWTKQVCLQTQLDDDGDGTHLTLFGIEFQTEEEAKENGRSPSVYLLCVGLLRRGMMCELERVLHMCGGFFCNMSVTYDGAVMVVQQTSYFVNASCFDRKPMEWFWMCGYTGWLWRAKDYLSCIVLYPLQVGCHIVSRTKQQWVTVVNSWQKNQIQVWQLQYMSGIYQ